MRKCIFRFLYLILIFSFVSCSSDPEDNLCSVELTMGHENSKGLSKSISLSVSSDLKYEYKTKPFNSEDSDAGWIGFDFSQPLVIKNLKPGFWTFSVRASKDDVVYYQGSTDINLSGSAKENVKIVLKKQKETTAKGTLVIRDSCNYEGLTVKLRFTGSSEENRTCPGVAEYSKSLDNGYYSVSIVYYKDAEVVGGHGFAVYVPAYETVVVNLDTVLINIPHPVDVTVDFISLSAPYVSGKACTGYTKGGVKVNFPYSTKINAGEAISISTLGLTPVYTNVSDMTSILASDYAELWAKDLPHDGYFSGSKRDVEKTPKVIVLHADEGRIGHACLSYLRDLETAYLEGVVTMSQSTFMNSKKLKKVYFSDSFLNFSYGPFENCSALTDLYFARPNNEGMSFPGSWNYNAPSGIELHYGVTI